MSCSPAGIPGPGWRETHSSWGSEQTGGSPALLELSSPLGGKLRQVYQPLAVELGLGYARTLSRAHGTHSGRASQPWTRQRAVCSWRACSCQLGRRPNSRGFLSTGAQTQGGSGAWGCRLNDATRDHMEKTAASSRPQTQAFTLPRPWVSDLQSSEK